MKSLQYHIRLQRATLLWKKNIYRNRWCGSAPASNFDNSRDNFRDISAQSHSIAIRCRYLANQRRRHWTMRLCLMDHRVSRHRCVTRRGRYQLANSGPGSSTSSSPVSVTASDSAMSGDFRISATGTEEVRPRHISDVYHWDKCTSISRIYIGWHVVNDFK